MTAAPRQNQRQPTITQNNIHVKSIQALRGIVCMMIVIYHICVLSNKYENGILYNSYLFILASGVDIFFVISGFVMAYTTYSQNETPGYSTEFLVSRISKIYPIYFIITAFVFIYSITGHGRINEQTGGVDWIASIFLFPTKSLPAIPVAWSLSFEVFFYIIFWIYLRFFYTLGIRFFLTLWFLITLIFGSIVDILGIDTMKLRFLLSPLTLEFIAGCFIGNYFANYDLMLNPKKKMKPLIVLTMSLIALAISCILTTTLGIDDSFSPQIRVIVFGIPAILLVLSCVYAEFSGSLKFSNRFIITLGSASYSIYLIHILVVHLLYRTYRLLFDNFNAPLFFVASILLSILTGVYFSILIERPATSITKKVINRLLRRRRCAN